MASAALVSPHKGAAGAGVEDEGKFKRAYTLCILISPNHSSSPTSAIGGHKAEAVLYFHTQQTALNGIKAERA